MFVIIYLFLDPNRKLRAQIHIAIYLLVCLFICEIYLLNILSQMLDLIRALWAADPKARPSSLQVKLVCVHFYHRYLFIYTV